MEHSQVNTSINKPQDTQGASPSAEFDQFAVDYNAGMENSVKKLVGDNPDIFIEVKARWLLANLAKPDARSLSTKQAAGLIRLSLPDGRGQAIIPFSADDPSMTQMRGEQ